MNHAAPSGLTRAVNDSIATLTIDHGPVNTVDPGLIQSFIEELTELSADASVRCIVLRGSGRIFIAGADVAVMRELRPETYHAMHRWADVQRLIELAPKPVIAAMNGHALGGGAELALACDLRILHERATFGFPEIDLGLFPGAGGSQRLPRLLGPHRAKKLMMDGTRLRGSEALDAGLVDMVAGDDFDDVVLAEAARLSAKPTATIGLLKEVVDRGWSRPIDEATEIELELVMRNITTHDAAEGLQSFLDKREPQFRGD